MLERSPIRLNHVGFLCSAPKRFLFTGGETKTFTVERMQDLRLEKVFEGILERHRGKELQDCLIGDFSSLSAPGIYRINCGGTNSRCFIICDKAYETVERTLFNYMVWQRCASNKGWKGACHTDDCVTLEDGTVKDLSGGHHQSGDTRKWAWGTSLGMIGLLEYGLNAKPAWNCGSLGEEIRWGCDYYLKLVRDDGSLIDSTFLPRGWSPGPGADKRGYGDYSAIWKGRKFYLSPAPAPAHWNMIRAMALASRFFRLTDPDYAEKCLVAADKIWNYMLCIVDRTKKYVLPEYPPLGHDGMHRLFAGFYQDSALDYAGILLSGIDLFKAIKDTQYAKAAADAATKLCGLQVGGNVEKNLAAACFWEAKDSGILANNYFYFWCTYIPLGLADILHTLPEHRDSHIWKEAAEKIAKQYILASERNPFGRLPGSWFTNGNDVFDSAAFFSFSTENSVPDRYTAGTAKRSSGIQLPVYYKHFSFCYNLDLIAGAVFLKKMSALLNEDRYIKTAFRQIDWLVGVNPYDASSIEGVGYNQPHRGIFGEFFPPVPQIPGAVFTGITSESFDPKSYGYDCEYDMPMVTWLMYLLALLKA